MKERRGTGIEQLELGGLCLHGQRAHTILNILNQYSILNTQSNPDIQCVYLQLSQGGELASLCVMSL